MTPSKRKLPSFGFMAVIGTYTLLIVFLLWGFSTPDLDRIWTLHHELKIGTTYKLKGSDRKILLNAMARHSELARALLPQGEIGLISANNRGWIYTPIATIIRTPKSDKYRVLRFEIQTSTDLIPYKIRVKGVSWQKDLSVDRQGIMDFELPRVKITFDTDLRFRNHALKVNLNAENHLFVPPDYCIMEVKANDAIPDWVTSLLARHNCQLQRVSKYCAGLACVRGLRVVPLVITSTAEKAE